MIYLGCPNCEGALRSMPEFLIECKSCHVSTRIPPCLDCGQVCQWNDSDEWIDNPLCQEHETAYPHCPCGHTEFQIPAEGAFWRGCLDCGHYFLEKRIELEETEDEEEERPIDPKMFKTLERLATWEARVDISKRNIHHEQMLEKIEEICKSCSPSLPKNVVQTASKIYQMTEDKRIMKGKRTLEFLIAVIYMACKQCDVIRSLEEILRHSCKAKEMSKKRKLISRYYRLLVMELGSS